MICPHCGIGFSPTWTAVAYRIPVDEDDDSELGEGYHVQTCFCTECKEIIVMLQYGHEYIYSIHGSYLNKIDKTIMIHPKFQKAKRAHEYVPKIYADLFLEASQVNNISPRASATLSRYLLQMLLHEEYEIKKRNLEDEINELEKKDVPSTLIKLLQIMRKVANFGAHPKKSTNSNEILAVEQGESDIMLELINELFDHMFVKPKQQALFLREIEEKYGAVPSKA